MNTIIAQAVAKAKEGAESHSAAWSRWFRNGRVGEAPKQNGTNNVSVVVNGIVIDVKATVGGNTRAIHTRINFKMNGKRATATQIEEIV